MYQTPLHKEHALTAIVYAMKFHIAIFFANFTKFTKPTFVLGSGKSGVAFDRMTTSIELANGCATGNGRADKDPVRIPG